MPVTGFSPRAASDQRNIASMATLKAMSLRVSVDARWSVVSLRACAIVRASAATPLSAISMKLMRYAGLLFAGGGWLGHCTDHLVDRVRRQQLDRDGMDLAIREDINVRWPIEVVGCVARAEAQERAPSFPNRSSDELTRVKAVTWIGCRRRGTD